MKSIRLSQAVALGAAATLALSGCAANTGTSPSTAPADASAGGGEVRVVEVNAFSSFNANTATGSVDVNGKISYATQSGFNYIDNDLNIVKNEKFGTYEVISQDPLTVKYTINEGVKWSDGEQLDADDLMLYWAIRSARFNDATVDAEGAVSSGTSYFDYAGDTSGLALTGLPEIGADHRSITLKYSKPFADWELAVGNTNADSFTPAHVVAKKVGMSQEELTKLIQDTPKGNPAKPVAPNAQLKKVANFWNSGYDTKTLPTDKSLYLSSGPFMVDSMVPDKSMTLVRNPDYDWGPMPQVDSIVVRYISEAPAQIQALRNGEVDIIAPQASADTMQQLEALGEQAKIEKGEELSYDHVDLNFNGVFKDQSVREAFMKTVPRAQIMDSIIKKLDPAATPLDSQVFVPANAGYAASVAANGSANFQDVDIAGARTLLGGKTPTVRLMYNKDNPNRSDAYALIAQSAQEAGFKVVDGGLGASSWAGALGTGTYDAALFGWTSTGVGVSGVTQIFGSGNASNFNNFSNKEADELMGQLILETDPAKQDELKAKIDRQIWGAAYGLPLFQLVGVQASAADVDGVQYMSNQTGVWWNFWDWSLSGK
ncbi:ABC transporter family substrate-binding protein [Paeniglutamicibacter cryotolerans]|uniref:Peptide/nickel transport system substrate-binding protein n=1 Tax=Paeniglutamicibacter cryotolerans TaxID=670079 RepID=A0A839QY02_9MICC|nr:ABC transporter family substrate-binding protein [Paeniglutamicibacter cryotolerans]MBB2996831.1 peptide/nickel transport system substrate-binding protein [Paeniglutamicibacter cryotolerans]